MSEPPRPVGLCAACSHAHAIETRRGAHFWLCRRARTDPAYPRYPRLPVLRCPGFERARPPARGEGA